MSATTIRCQQVMVPATTTHGQMRLGSRIRGAKLSRVRDTSLHTAGTATRTKTGMVLSHQTETVTGRIRLPPHQTETVTAWIHLPRREVETLQAQMTHHKTKILTEMGWRETSLGNIGIAHTTKRKVQRLLRLQRPLM